MSIYSGCFQTTVVTTTVPSMDFKASANALPRIMEWGYVNGATTQCTYGIGLSANTPTQTSTTALLAEDSNNTVASATTSAVTWSTAPTVPSVFFRRPIIPATIGAGMIYTWPRGLTIKSNANSIVNWNIAASSAVMNIHVVTDE